MHLERESLLEFLPESPTEECDSDSLPDGQEASHAPHQSSVTLPHFAPGEEVSHAPHQSSVTLPHLAPFSTERPLQTSAAVRIDSPTKRVHCRQTSSGLLSSVSMPVASPTSVSTPRVASPVLAAAVPVALPNLLTSSGRISDSVAKKTSRALELPGQVPAQRVDFSGKWCMTNVDGDFGQLLVDADVSWVLRRMAKSMNYGLGKTFQTITQNGDDFVLEHWSPLKSTTMEFSANAGYQETVGADGLPVLVNAQWDGMHLTMQCKKPEGRSFASTRRYIQGGEMVIEAPLSTGATLKRFFTKQ